MIVIAALIVVIGLTVLITRASRTPNRVRGSLALQALRATSQISTADRREWIDAMVAECSSIDDEAERRRFARSCLRGAFFVTSGDGTSSAVLLFLGALIAVAGALAVYALAHYPGLRTGASWIVYLGAFVGGLAFYFVAGVYAAGLGSATARRIGILCGLPALPFCWACARFNGAWTGAIGMSTVLLPALAALCAIATQRNRVSATAAAMCSAVVAGLLAFIGLAATSYAMSSNHPTAAMLREFRASGVHDYRTWLVGDNLGGACVMMLLFIPLIGMPLGLLASKLAPREHPDESHPRLA
jgi:hypothetical protein